MLDRFYKFFTSVSLAVVLLALGLLIVFFGTLAQGFFGLYITQARYFQTMFIDLQAMYVGFHKFVDMISQGFGYPLAPLEMNTVLSVPRIPILPGGYLVGGLLVINLFAAHLRYYRPGFKRLGIAMLHLGVVLLLLGQFATDMLSNESHMRIREGASSNYSESDGHWELVIIDASNPEKDKVVAISASRLAKGGEITHPELPFKLRAKSYYANSELATKAGPGLEPVQADSSAGMPIWWRELPLETRMNARSIPSGVVEVIDPQGTARPILVSGYLAQPQLLAGGSDIKLLLRPERYYKPFRLHLIDFRFDRYPGTQIPKNFSSRVRVERPDTGESREVTIRMNEPLRYEGETFFQASYDEADEKGTVLQVVDNPSWLTPYLACVLVAVGMTYQFLLHLIGFAAKRKTA